MVILLRVFVCTFFLWLCLYRFVDKQNELILLRREIPELQKKALLLKEDIAELNYEVHRFQSPANLNRLAQQPQFGHLRPSYEEDVWVVDFEEEVRIEEDSRAP